MFEPAAARFGTEEAIRDVQKWVRGHTWTSRLIYFAPISFKECHVQAIIDNLKM
jgi:hypothetical protein